MTFTCKDCELDFPSAKEFVYHVPECKPENIRLILIQAIREAKSKLGVKFESDLLANELLKQFKVTRL